MEAPLLDFGARVDEDGSRTIDRAWLRGFLGLGVEGKIEWGKEIVSYNLPEKSEGGEEVAEVRFRDRTTADGRFVVGVDGIKIRVRRQLQQERRMLDPQCWVM
jgi:hypothetical protein